MKSDKNKWLRIFNGSIFKINVLEKQAGISGRAIDHWVNARRGLNESNEEKLDVFMKGLGFEIALEEEHREVIECIVILLESGKLNVETLSHALKNKMDLFNYGRLVP